MIKRKLIIGNYDTALEGLWTLSALNLSAPELREEFVDIPGRSGALDMSTVLTDGEPSYTKRMLEATLESSEGTRDEREMRIRNMINQLDGLEFKIILPDDPLHYLTGRVRVNRLYNDLAHASVTVTAVCDPWLYSIAETQLIIDAETNIPLVTTLYNRGRRYIAPTITVEGNVTLELEDKRWTLSAGTYVLPDLVLKTGSYPLHYSGFGIIKITYREAVLA